MRPFSIKNFNTPANCMVVEQYVDHDGHTFAIVVRNQNTLQFTLFEEDGESYKKVAVKKDPFFKEVEKIVAKHR